MEIRAALQTASVAPIDAEAMLAFLFQADRTFLLSHPEHVLSTSQEAVWKSFVHRRNAGEPVAYIIGQREFYGRTFLVDRRVHIPRPSTENLVTMALDFLKIPKDDIRDLEPGIIGMAKVLRDCSGVKTIVDIGTGSGCIATTLALERPDLQVIAIDIRADALEVAKDNARRLGASHIKFLEGDTLQPMKNFTAPFIVVSNPPYVRRHIISGSRELEWEPRIALDGGVEGDDQMQYFLRESTCHASVSGYIVESPRPSEKSWIKS